MSTVVGVRSVVRRRCADRREDASDQVVPAGGVGRLGADRTLHEQAEADRADEVQHRVGIDVGGERAVGDGLADQRFERGAPPVVGVVDGGRDLGLAARRDVGFESHRLVERQRGVEPAGTALEHVGHSFHAVECFDIDRGVADHGFAQQVVLGAESPVDGAGRQAGLPDDVGDLCALVALAGEHPAGGIEELLAQFVVLHQWRITIIRDVRKGDWSVELTGDSQVWLRRLPGSGTSLISHDSTTTKGRAS